MIVIKGDTTQSLPSELTFVQKFTAFVKYRSTQTLAFFGTLAAFWNFVPDDVKFDLYADYPLVGKIKTPVYLTILAFVFYRTRMATQVVTVPAATSQPPAVPLTPSPVQVVAPASVPAPETPEVVSPKT